MPAFPQGSTAREARNTQYEVLESPSPRSSAVNQASASDQTPGLSSFTFPEAGMTMTVI